MEGTLKILFNEDVKLDAELIWRKLKKSEISFKKLLVDNKKDLIEGLKSFEPDIIISDYSLPQFTGMQALIIRNEISPSTPFILVTGSNNETVAVDCMKAGADDYILKDNLSRLGISVNNAINKKKVLEEKNIAEKELYKSEAKYRSIFENVQDLFYETAIDGTILEVSPSIVTISRGQYKREELIGKSMADFYSHPKELNLFMEALKAKGSVTDFEIMLKNRDGSLIPCSVSSKISFDPEGNPVKISGSMRDISERKKAERTLHDIIDNNPMSIQILDIEGFTLKVNQAFIKLFGSVPPSDFSMFNDIQLKEKGFAELLIRIKNCEVVHFPDMQFNPHESISEMPDCLAWIKAVGFALLDGNGKPEKIVLMHENITERKLAEEKLRQSYEFNESLLKTIPFGMDIVDEEGNVIFLSENFKRILGEDALRKKCWEVYRDDKKQSSDSPLFKGIEIGETETYEAHGVIGNRIFEINHTGMMYDGKKVMLEIFQDITERKKVEVELINAKEKAEESDRLKSAFLTNMSHEIRTPMNGIIGFTELLKEPNLSSDDQQDFIQTIQISGARMLNTINSIVDMSKIESGLMNLDIRETNINEKIEFTYKFFKPEVETKGLKFLFKTTLQAKEAIIKTDNEKVYGILTNLVRNAIKFTYEGSIEFGCVLKSDIEPGSTEQSRSAELLFFVKDTGIGIPETHKELIFERFRQGSESHTRGYEGSGLGLSICKSYVEMLGGRIWVESEVGKGSIFYFTIPYNPVSEEIHTIENVVFTENKEVQIKKLKILIVEDDKISYSLLSRILQKISKEVLHSLTGVEAVEACRNNPDIDLVLMDIRMPKMDGNEATRKIRQFNKDVIIIAQTAYGFAGDREEAIEAGCNDYITKPISVAL